MSQKRKKSGTRALRFNHGKARLSWVPASLEEAVAEVLWQSCDENGGKYPRDNWRRGMPWTEVGDSAMRHLKEFLQKGVDMDPESGLHHLKHAATNVAILLDYLQSRPEFDDRPLRRRTTRTVVGQETTLHCPNPDLEVRVAKRMAKLQKGGGC